MPPGDRTYDLVVVGGSFAGLTCARAAALRGLKVAVLEAKRDPGDGVRTTGIFVKEAAEEQDIPWRLTRKIHGVRLYSPSLRSVALQASHYYFLATDTAAVLRWLAEEAEAAGADIRLGTRFDGAQRDGDLIRMAGLGIATRFLVGADGARSRVAQAFGLGRNRRLLVGLELEYDAAPGLDPAFLHCFLDSRIAPGYIGWALQGVGVVQVGVAASRPHKPDIKALTGRIEAMFGLDAARIVERRSGLIPAGGIVRPFAADRVLLIGDAAGLVSPLTAGGIRLACRFGRRAAQLVSDHLAGDGPDPGAVLAAEYPSFFRQRLLRRVLKLRPPNWVLDRTLGSPPLRSFAERIYFHRPGSLEAPDETGPAGAGPTTALADPDAPARERQRSRQPTSADGT